ncbi:putative glycosyl hydrolase [Candidatus Planktophila lacus]|uniref:glycosyl hydrolase family 18 protein n=1 Tax=Candidatus Planktophila lacus TaxID=1884913 RepID=UPI000BAC978A|nr:glycosyl hydrolase family 18 protein [Candidatus Planktophila lacus]ASY28622.1 putative glycosyl hydrolase [Candidatus Planktophila lacus]
MTASRVKRLTSKSLVVVFALSVVFSPQAHSANQPRKILTGWIPYYSMKTSLPAALNNADLIKEVMPFWYTLKYNGKTKSAYVSDLYVSGNPSIPIATPLAAMRAAGFQIIPTITDGTDKLVLSNLLANPTSRTQIAKTLNDYVMANNFDGIDLDFEGFAFVDGNTTWAKTAPSWVALVKELSGLLRANNKLLSVSTPYNFNPAEKQKGYTVYAWPQIAPFIDRLRIMTYDYSVSKVGPIGPLAWTEKTVAYAASIMPASKVYLGLAGYGRDWVTKVEGVCPAPFANAIKVGAKAATFVMRDAAALAASYQVTPVFDAKFGEATFTYTKSYEGTTADGRSTICTATRTAWYQNAQSYKLRSELVAKYKLGGVTAWTLGMEEPLAMEAIRQTALGISPVKVVSALTVDKTAALYGNSVSISAQLNLEDKSPAANLPLRIEGKSANDATWRVLGTAVTGVDGRFTTPILLGKATSIRIATDGTWERAESLSNEISILIDRTISISAPGSVKANSSFAIDGVVRPRSAGAQVSLMKFSAGAWKKVAIATTNEQGVFAFALEKEPRQVARYQIIVEGDQLWRQVAAPEFSIIIR